MIFRSALQAAQAVCGVDVVLLVPPGRRPAAPAKLKRVSRPWCATTESRAKRRELRIRLAQRQGGRCALCGGRFGDTPRGGPEGRIHRLVTLDHIRPLVRGGRDVLSNLQAAHAYCNSVKGSQC